MRSKEHTLWVEKYRSDILDNYVDYFIIVESIYTHKGEKRNLKFNSKKFARFKNKIKLEW